MTFDCKNVNPCPILERYAPDGIDILIDTVCISGWVDILIDTVCMYVWIYLLVDGLTS